MDFIFKALIALGAAVAAAAIGMIVYQVYVEYLNKKKAIELAQKQMLADKLSKTVKAMIDSKDSNKVDIGFYLRNGEKAGKLEVSAGRIDNDIRVGDVLVSY